MRVKDVQEWRVLRKKLYVCRWKVLRQNSILSLNMNFFPFCLFTFCFLKVFLLICMLNKRENHNFRKPKPPTSKFYRPTPPTAKCDPRYPRQSKTHATYASRAI